MCSRHYDRGRRQAWAHAVGRLCWWARRSGLCEGDDGVGGGDLDGTASLEEVHGSIAIPSDRGSGRRIRRFFAFLGPAYLVSVGYMDPGNWATDLQGGARFGYALIWVLLMSNLMAILLQTLAARLGVVTGHDLAQACRAEYSRGAERRFVVLAEVAIAACDLAEILGTVIAPQAPLRNSAALGLFADGLRHVLDSLFAAVGNAAGRGRHPGARRHNRLVFRDPDLPGQAGRGGGILGLRPSLPAGSLYIAIGILGATVMPHNLYLHSALVQTRRIGADAGSKSSACRYYLLDAAIALNVAFFVNAAILIVSAAVFWRHGLDVTSIEEAYKLLPEFLGKGARSCSVSRLVCRPELDAYRNACRPDRDGGVSQSEDGPVVRRLITRLIALVPAVVVIALPVKSDTEAVDS